MVGMARRKADRAPFAVPAEIRIRGKRWLVLNDLDLEPRGADAKSARDLQEKSDGRCHRDKREIHLSVQQPPRALASTFLHELLHACVPADGSIPDVMEERLILDIEGALLDALEQLVWAPRPVAR